MKTAVSLPAHSLPLHLQCFQVLLLSGDLRLDKSAKSCDNPSFKEATASLLRFRYLLLKAYECEGDKLMRALQVLLIGHRFAI